MAYISGKIEEIRNIIQKKNENKLMDAIASNDLAKVKAIHEKGGDFNRPFSEGTQYSHALSFAIYSTDEIFAYVLEHTNPEVIKQANILDAYDQPIPLIHRLARKDDKNKMEKLLNSGVVNIDQLDNRGYTPLADAAAHHSWKTASFLIKQGADVTKEVEGKPIHEILANNKEGFMKDNLYFNDYNKESLGKTGNSSTGATTEYQEEIAKLQTDVAKTIMLAERAVKR